MSLQTPEGLRASVETLMRTLQELVRAVEQLRAENAELKARFNAHIHTVTTTTTATAGDGSATATSTAGTPR